MGCIDLALLANLNFALTRTKRRPNPQTCPFLPGNPTEFFVKQSGALFGLHADAIAIKREPQPIRVGIRHFVVFQNKRMIVFPVAANAD